MSTGPIWLSWSGLLKNTTQLARGVVTDEDLTAMKNTVERADNMAFVLVAPIDFSKMVESLDGQRRVLELHREMRKFFDDVCGCRRWDW